MKKPNILVPVMAFSLAFLNKLYYIFILQWALQITQTTQPATFFHSGCMPRSLSFSLWGMVLNMLPSYYHFHACCLFVAEGLPTKLLAAPCGVLANMQTTNAQPFSRPHYMALDYFSLN